jgi:hypothetical protein
MSQLSAREMLDLVKQGLTEPLFPEIPTLKIGLEQIQQMPIDDLVAMYIAERRQLAVERHAYEAREAEFKNHMELISMELCARGDKLGVDSFKTAAGTAYRNVKRSFNIINWDSLTQYVKETGNFQVFQKRLSPNSVKDIESTDGKLPPGVEPYTEVEFNVRSPVARGSRSSNRQE